MYKLGDIRHKGKDHPNWKGDDLSYIRMHKWVAKVAGRPLLCEICKNVFPKTHMEWSNKDHKYKRDLKFWQRLCRKCHKAYDRKIFGITAGRSNKTDGRLNRK